MRITLVTFFVLTHCFSAAHSYASVTVYTNRQQWLDAVGHHTFIGFTEYPEFTTITTQYGEQGIWFTDGNEFISESSAYRDGHALGSV